MAKELSILMYRGHVCMWAYWEACCVVTWILFRKGQWTFFCKQLETKASLLCIKVKRYSLCHIYRGWFRIRNGKPTSRYRGRQFSSICRIWRVKTSHLAFSTIITATNRARRGYGWCSECGARKSRLLYAIIHVMWIIEILTKWLIVEMFKVRMQGQYGAKTDKRLRAVIGEMWSQDGFRHGIMRGFWVSALAYVDLGSLICSLGHVCKGNTCIRRVGCFNTLSNSIWLVQISLASTQASSVHTLPIRCPISFSLWILQTAVR